MSDQSSSLRTLAEIYDRAREDRKAAIRQYRHQFRCIEYDAEKMLVAALIDAGHDGIGIRGRFYRLVKSGTAYELRQEDAAPAGKGGDA